MGATFTKSKWGSRFRPKRRRRMRERTNHFFISWCLVIMDDVTSMDLLGKPLFLGGRWEKKSQVFAGLDDQCLEAEEEA